MTLVSVYLDGFRGLNPKNSDQSEPWAGGVLHVKDRLAMGRCSLDIVLVDAGLCGISAPRFCAAFLCFCWVALSFVIEVQCNNFSSETH
jgi:hypothetical protein